LVLGFDGALLSRAWKDALTRHEIGAPRGVKVQPFERRKPARRTLPNHLPRERVVYPVPKACPCCGGALHKLGEDPSAMVGGALVVVVLFLFLFDWRTSVISCTAIPLSLLAAVLALQWLGESLNTMTLGGLAIAIGEVVDDAVIGVENVVRRLRESRQRGAHDDGLRLVLEAILEVRGAVVYATFAVLAVFFPILALSGVAGRLFGPMGLAYILAVLASLVVALTVTPALCVALLVKDATRQPSDPPLVRWMRTPYGNLLRRVEGYSKAVMGGAIALAISAAAIVPFFGGTFLPDLREGHFVLHASMIPGTSLEESLRIGKRVTEALLQIPEVRFVAQRAGRAEAGQDTTGTHFSEYEIELAHGLSGDAQRLAERRIREALAQFAGVVFSLKTFLTERIEETVSGFTAAVVVNVFGGDLGMQEATANAVARVLAQVPGATDVQVRAPGGMPQISISLRPTDLQRWGVDAVEVLELVRTAYQGDVVGQGYEGSTVFNVLVILAAPARARIDEIGAFPIRTPSGAFIFLRQVADVYEASGRYQVLHEGAERVQAVTANVRNRDVETFMVEAKARIAREVRLPPGGHIEFAGTAEAQARSRRDLLVNASLAGLAIILLLSVATGHWRNLALVLINLPFSFVGGVLAVAMTGGLAFPWLDRGIRDAVRHHASHFRSHDHALRAHGDDRRPSVGT
jgi:Cu/Ag efflux pump CusA